MTEGIGAYGDESVGTRSPWMCYVLPVNNNKPWVGLSIERKNGAGPARIATRGPCRGRSGLVVSHDGVEMGAFGRQSQIIRCDVGEESVELGGQGTDAMFGHQNTSRFPPFDGSERVYLPLDEESGQLLVIDLDFGENTFANLIQCHVLTPFVPEGFLPSR